VRPPARTLLVAVPAVVALSVVGSVAVACYVADQIVRRALGEEHQKLK